MEVAQERHPRSQAKGVFSQRLESCVGWSLWSIPSIIQSRQWQNLAYLQLRPSLCRGHKGAGILENMSTGLFLDPSTLSPAYTDPGQIISFVPFPFIVSMLPLSSSEAKAAELRLKTKRKRRAMKQSSVTQNHEPLF